MSRDWIADVSLEYLREMSAEPIPASALKMTNEQALLSLSDSDRRTLISSVVRYCVLKHCSGLRHGYIEESEIKKLEIPHLAECGVKPVLRLAARKLQRHFGLELVPVWKMPASDAAGAFFHARRTSYSAHSWHPYVSTHAVEYTMDRIPKESGRYLLRTSPSLHPEVAMFSSEDGLTTSQLGFLMAVLCIILLSESHSVREDVLFTKLGEMDPAQFGGMQLYWCALRLKMPCPSSPPSPLLSALLCRL